MKLFYSPVYFVPDTSAGEKVCFGLFVGSDEEGFAANWWPERIEECFGVDIRESIVRWLETFPPKLTVAELEWRGTRGGIFQVRAPIPVIGNNIEDAMAKVEDVFHRTNTDIRAVYNREHGA